jgi:uncharacterized protein YrrD
MIRASELRGRSVVDLDSAVKLGDVDEILLDPESRRVAGFSVGRGANLLGGGSPVEKFVPASAVHAIGGDVVTVRGAGQAGAADASAYPRLGHVVGRKMVTHGGTVLGPIDDVLIDPTDGRIVGYALGGKAGGALAGLFGGRDDAARGDYVRADADLRVGPELVVVPDDAVVSAGAERSPEAAAPTVFGWPDPEPGTARGGSSWIHELSEAPLPASGAAPRRAEAYDPAPVAEPVPSAPVAPLSEPVAPIDEPIAPARPRAERPPPDAPADDLLAPTQPLDVRSIPRRRPTGG